MNHIGQSDFLQALGWAVVNSLWQMALIWVSFQLVTGLFRKMHARAKSALATTLLFSGFAWFVYSFLSVYLNAGGTISASNSPSFVGISLVNAWLYSTLPVASIIYLVLLLFPLLQFIRNYRYVQLIRRNGLAKANAEWKLFVNRVSQQLGIRQKVQVWVSEFVNSPVTVGYLKPMILVPLAAVNNLTPSQLEAVLLHELAHIRRFDYFINLIIRFIQSILYFNPFVKALVLSIEREREKSCDDLVIQFQYDPHGYASALLELERVNINFRPLVVGASGSGHDMLNRIEAILGVQKKQAVSFNKIAAVFACLLCVIVLNALLIISKPASEHKPEAASTLLANVTSPAEFFSDIYVDASMAQPVIDHPKQIPLPPAPPANNKLQGQLADIAGHALKLSATWQPLVDHITANPFATAAAYMDKPDIPALEPEQVQQVRQTIDASKKVLAEGQWKEIEQKMADVFTQQEKDALRQEYRQEMNKKMSQMDWKRWESKLSEAYDKVDWDNINTQLDMAVNNIRIDSLTHVYTKTLINLSCMQSELHQAETNAIPDTEISLQSIQDKKKQVEDALKQLKALKNRKVVHL